MVRASIVGAILANLCSRSVSPSSSAGRSTADLPGGRRAHVAGNGRANWFKGVQLVTVYLIIALMFYLLPTAS